MNERKSETLPTCLLCGSPAEYGAVYVPNSDNWDVPQGCWLAVRYSLCRGCIRIEQPLLAELAECFLLAKRGAWLVTECGHG